MKDAPLEVIIRDDELVISAGINTLVAVIVSPEPGFIITNADVAALEILSALKDEEEDGTTVVHKMLDLAARDAWEQGGEGFEDAEEEPA